MQNEDMKSCFLKKSRFIVKQHVKDTFMKMNKIKWVYAENKSKIRTFSLWIK